MGGRHQVFEHQGGVIMRMRRQVVAAAVTATLALISSHGAASAQNSSAPFFAGKQIRLITHVGPASGYAVWARLIFPGLPETQAGIKDTLNNKCYIFRGASVRSSAFTAASPRAALPCRER